ncbi:DUF134 domain-containing protein [Patescibacteria group bacterium]
MNTYSYSFKFRKEAKMPNLDGKGPQGKGPLSGKGRGRCKKARNIRFSPTATYFKPRGIPMTTLEEIELMEDELEALKLYKVDGHDQTMAAKHMGVSQPTFSRMLNSAIDKLADAIVNSKAIKIG